MFKSILKKFMVLGILVFSLFGAVSYAGAVTDGGSTSLGGTTSGGTAPSPILTFQLLALDASTLGPVTFQTRKITIGIKVTNNSSHTIGSAEVIIGDVFLIDAVGHVINSDYIKIPALYLGGFLPFSSEIVFPRVHYDTIVTVFSNAVLTKSTFVYGGIQFNAYLSPKLKVPPKCAMAPGMGSVGASSSCAAATIAEAIKEHVSSDYSIYTNIENYIYPVTN